MQNSYLTFCLGLFVMYLQKNLCFRENHVKILSNEHASEEATGGGKSNSTPNFLSQEKGIIYERNLHICR